MESQDCATLTSEPRPCSSLTSTPSAQLEEALIRDGEMIHFVMESNTLVLQAVGSHTSAASSTFQTQSQMCNSLVAGRDISITNDINGFTSLCDTKKQSL